MRSVSLRALSKLTGRRSTLTSWPDDIALEPVGEGRLDRLGHGDARDRPVDRRMDIVGAQPQMGIGEWLPVGAELPHIALVGEEVGVAAGDGGREHRLAGREIEDARARRLEHGIAELVDGRRAFLARPAGDEIQAVDRRPVGAGAERRQRAEIRQLVDLRIGVEGQVAERAEVAVAARDRQVEIDRRLARRPPERGLGVGVRREAGGCPDARCCRRA